MIVCSCNRLTKEELAAAIADGKTDPHDVIEHCGGMPRCCGCFGGIDRMINAATKDKPKDDLYVEVQ